MRRLIEPSHLDLCCLQKPIIISVAVKQLKQAAKDIFSVFTLIFGHLNPFMPDGLLYINSLDRFISI